MDHQPGLFAILAEIIGREGGNIGAIDIVKITEGKITRDITVDTSDDEHQEQIINALEEQKA